MNVRLYTIIHDGFWQVTLSKNWAVIERGKYRAFYIPPGWLVNAIDFEASLCCYRYRRMSIAAMLFGGVNFWRLLRVSYNFLLPVTFFQCTSMRVIPHASFCFKKRKYLILTGFCSSLKFLILSVMKIWICSSVVDMFYRHSEKCPLVAKGCFLT